MHGTDACIESIKNRKAYLILIAEDAAQNSKDKFEYLSKEYGVELLYFGESKLLSKAIGKNEKIVLTVEDSGFSNKIIQLIKESKGDI